MSLIDGKNIPTIAEINKIKKTHTAMSLFAGCGGSSIGYRMAGFDILYANEFIPIAAETYRANASKTTWVDESDIRTVKASKILKS